MLCPRCRAENSEGTLNCSRCGRGLVSVRDAQTPGKDDVTAPSGLSAHPEPSAAATLAPGTEFGPRYRIESLQG